MQATWILVADEGRARVLTLDEAGPRPTLREIEELTDAGAHADNADLRRDAQGRFYGKGEQMMGHTAPPRTDELEKEAGLFARRVAQWLADARRKGRYEHLRVAAAPRFLGRLRQAMEPEVSEAVTEELDKDLVQMPERELFSYFYPERRDH